MIFDGLSTELVGAAIYDLGSSVVNRLTQNEWVQRLLTKYNIKAEQHDFATRYLESLVELSLQDKPVEVLNFFREQSISRTFYEFYYGDKNTRGSEAQHQQALEHCVAALKVGDEIKAANINPLVEVIGFWEIFRQKVQESKTVREVELEQQIKALLEATDNTHEAVARLVKKLEDQGKENFEVDGQHHRIGEHAAKAILQQYADKIYNINHLGTANFYIYEGERKIPRLLTPPPFVPEIFIGRNEDLQRIHELLFAPNGNLHLLVNGEGGVGKTSIASKYFHTYQEEYAHAAWVFKDNSIADALLLLAVPLGLKFEDFWDNTQRLEVLLQKMANLKKPCLLIIDNANELNDLNAYLPQLQRCSNFHVLLTTRISEHGNTAQYKIAALPQDLALQAFKSHYQAFESQEEAQFFQIYEAVQGNTLVLELLAKNLNNFNNKLKKRYLLAELKQELENGLLHLSKTSMVGTRYQAKGTGLRNESIEVIIMAMYDLGELSTPESHLLSIFAVLPAESIPFARLETLLPEYEDLDTHLLALAQKGWMEYNAEAAAFKCSPVVQEVVRMKQADLLENCASLISALCTQLDTENLHLDNYQHSTVFVRYGEAVIGVFTIADDNLGTLCQNIGTYYTATGDLNKTMTVYQKMEAIQTELLEAQPDDPGFKNGLAISYSKLGDTHTALGNLQQALTFFEQSNELTEALYAAYPQNVSFKNGLAISYSQLGETHTALGNLQQALTFFEQYNALEQELYAAYPQNVEFKNNLAISYSKLGSTHTALGNLQQALTFFDDQTKLFEELYAAYPQNVSFKNGLAISYDKLGSTHTALGNLQQALTFFEKRNQLGEALYAAYPQNVEFKNGLAISYLLLGQFYEQELKNKEKARAYYFSGKELLEKQVTNFPGYVQFQTYLDWVNDKLAE